MNSTFAQTELPKENTFIADPNSEIDFTEKDIAQMTEQEKFMNGIIDKNGNRYEKLADTETVDLRKKEEHKRLNIHTFASNDNETCLAGTDEFGNELCIWFDSYDFLSWIDNDSLEYIKKQLTKYINQK